MRTNPKDFNEEAELAKSRVNETYAKSLKHIHELGEYIPCGLCDGEGTITEWHEKWDCPSCDGQGGSWSGESK